MVDGVQRVSLASSDKSDTAVSSGPVTAAGSGAGGCNVSRHFPTFNMVVFFDPQDTTLSSGAAGTGAATTAAATTTGSATPAATTTPTGGSK